MLIHLGYDLIFDTPLPVPFVVLLKVHPSRAKDLRQLDELRVDSATHFECYSDSFGNNCCRFLAPAGQIRLSNSTLIQDTGEPDPIVPLGSRDTGAAFAQECSSVPAEQPVLRSGSDVEHCGAAFWGDRLRMESGGDRVQVGSRQCDIRIPICKRAEDGLRCFYKSLRCLPRLSTPGDDDVPSLEHTGPLRDRVFGGHRSSSGACADGF